MKSVHPGAIESDVNLLLFPLPLAEELSMALRATRDA
jgi:hypothetical protein